MLGFHYLQRVTRLLVEFNGASYVRNEWMNTIARTMTTEIAHSQKKPTALLSL